MNKIYNHNWLIDIEILNDSLKFYQSTVIIPEWFDENMINENIDNKIKNNEIWNKLVSTYEYPESLIGKYKISDVDNWVINVLDEFRKILSSEKLLMFQPIFTFINFCAIPNGHYVVDFEKNELLLYKLCDINYCHRINNNKISELCISYFVDIHKSIFLNGSLGLTESIFQIGRTIALHESKINKKKVESLKINAAQQFFTRSLGLNAREQLFIKNHIFFPTSS